MQQLRMLQRITFTGVEITTRQLAKCEWKLELASNFLTYSPSWRVLFSSSQRVFFSPLVHTVQMLGKDTILVSFSLIIWRVKNLNYSPVWREP
jgi:hypothetical protein